MAAKLLTMALALVLVGYSISTNAADSNTCAASAKGAGVPSANIGALCRGAENSAEPGACYSRVMGGTVNYGGGTRWMPGNAVKLCAGATDANARVGCFSGKLSQGVVWGPAIDQCTGKNASVDPTVLARTGQAPKNLCRMCPPSRLRILPVV